MQRDAEKRRGLLIGHTPGIQNRAAPGALLPGNVHYVLGKARVHNGKNHLMIVGYHGYFPLSKRLLLINRYRFTPMMLLSGTAKATPLPLRTVWNFSSSVFRIGLT